MFVWLNEAFTRKNTPFKYTPSTKYYERSLQLR